MSEAIAVGRGVTTTMSIAMPTTKTTPARIVARRASRRSEVPRRRRGELRVLFDEGALHLLEQSQLLFGEWHHSSTVSCAHASG